MLYNEFIKAGITLEEIELMEIYAERTGLELGEHNGELCFIDSETEKVQFTGLDRMVKAMKIINIELKEKIYKNGTKEEIDLMIYASGLISTIENKVKLANTNIA